jgi:hypothetical protein
LLAAPPLIALLLPAQEKEIEKSPCCYLLPSRNRKPFVQQRPTAAGPCLSDDSKLPPLRCSLPAAREQLLLLAAASLPAFMSACSAGLSHTHAPFPARASVRIRPRVRGGRQRPKDGFVRKNIRDGVIQHLHRICFDADPQHSTKQPKIMDDAGPSYFILLYPPKQTHPKRQSSHLFSFSFLFPEIYFIT